jgi:hypothetical protein
MGCGCKNKGNTSQTTQTQTTQTQSAAPKTSATNESVQNAIKKTIEKYYNANKSR